METADRETISVRPRSATLAAIGYVPPLFLAPLLHDPADDFAREHGRQSLVTFVLFALGWLAIWLVEVLFTRLLGGVILLGFLFRALAWLVHYVGGTALSLAYLGVMVAGIVQAARGRRWRAPFIGPVNRRMGNDRESKPTGGC